MKQASLYHDELKVEGKGEYFFGWLNKFKKRHGLEYLKINGDKASADEEAAENYLNEFGQIVTEANLTPKQVYNADETIIFWRYCPRKTWTTAQESAPTGIKDANDRIIGVMLGYANAVGTRKCRPTVIGKSLHPGCFKGVNFLPVNYANKNAWRT